MKLSTRIAGHAIALAMRVLRRTCRIRFHEDPRPALRVAGQSYVFAVLHAHQISSMIENEPCVAAMVSQSADGDLLLPVLKLVGVKPIRGSSRRRGKDKGGRQALDKMIDHVNAGNPAYIAVDGPRGPRNRVRKGIAQLSMSTGAGVIAAIAIPNHRWILRKTWDRMQIPKPFCMIDAYFAQPIYAHQDESVEQFRRRIEDSLNSLEQEHDPTEALPP